MLLGTLVAEFASTLVSALEHALQRYEQSLTLLGEQTLSLGMAQQVDGTLIGGLARQPAAAMTAVVVDEESS